MPEVGVTAKKCAKSRVSEECTEDAAVGWGADGAIAKVL
jgi:hypothetical protein